LLIFFFIELVIYKLKAFNLFNYMLDNVLNTQEKREKDITEDFSFNYYGYCCYMFWIYFWAFACLLPPLILNVWHVFIPILIFFLSIIISLLYFHNKKIILIKNYYYGRIRVNVINKLNITREILNIDSSNGGFYCIETDEYRRHRLHIFNTFKDNKDLDLRTINIENKAPKFYWHFKDVSTCIGLSNFEKILREMIGESMIINSEIKFISEEKGKHLKYFNSKNFLSFTLKNYIKLYIIIFAIILFFINQIIIINLDEKYDENGKIQFSLKVYFSSFGWLIITVVSTILGIIFHYNKRRIDIFVKDRILFIGITTFFQKSYKKKFLFELNSIQECGFLENNTTLRIKLKNGNTQTIYKFSEKKEELKIISDKLKQLLY